MVEHNTVLQFLENSGYKAKMGENNAIESATSGMNFVILLPDNQSAKFSLVVKNKVDFNDRDSNAFNKKYRFAKVYLDDDQDIVLECDLLLITMDSEKTLGQCMLLWGSVVSALIREMQIKATRAEAAP